MLFLRGFFDRGMWHSDKPADNVLELMSNALYQCQVEMARVNTMRGRGETDGQLL